MFDKLLMKVVGRYMRYFLSEFDPDKFRLGIMSGEVELHDIMVNPHFIKELLFISNFDVTSIACSRVLMQFPWLSLSSTPVLFELDRVDMEVNESFGFSPPPRQGNWMRPQISYGVIGKCFDGVHISIKEVHVVMQCKGGEESRPTPYKVTVDIDGLDICSVSPLWKDDAPLEQSFVRTPDHKFMLIHKQGKLKAVTLRFYDGEGGEGVFFKNVAMTMNLRVKRRISDMSVEAGQFHLIIDGEEGITLSFTDEEYSVMSAVVAALGVAFTKKIKEEESDNCEENDLVEKTKDILSNEGSAPVLGVPHSVNAAQSNHLSSKSAPLLRGGPDSALVRVIPKYAAVV